VGKWRRWKLNRTVDAQTDKDSKGGSSVGMSSVARAYKEAESSALAMSNIYESIAQIRKQLESFLYSHGLLYISISLLIGSLLVIVIEAVVLFLELEKWNTQIARTRMAYRVRSTAQELVAMVFQLGSLLGSSSVTSSAVSANAAMVTALADDFEANFNYLMAGPGMDTDPQVILFLKSTRVFLNTYNDPDSPQVAAFSAWSIGPVIDEAARRAIDYALTMPTEKQFFSNASVLLLTENGPSQIAYIFSKYCEEMSGADSRLFNENAVAFAVLLGILFIAILGSMYLATWNFRKAASEKVRVLKLFLLIPRESLKRLANDAKEQVEKFISGDSPDDKTEVLAVWRPQASLARGQTTKAAACRTRRGCCCS
jgi:hypothetical protein